MTLLKKVMKRGIEIALRFLFIDYFLFIGSKFLFFLSRLLFLRDWKYNKGVPRFFKHQINLTNWRFDPTQWVFVLRGVYARNLMFPNCKVLDLCCGDGTYSFLFFSDISTHIDAIDYDASAIAYAKRYYQRPNISYRRIDAITEQFPANDYDVIVWNAGICYFTTEEIHIVLSKICLAGKKSMILCGMLPKANRHIDHRTEFEDKDALKALFSLHFEEISVEEIKEGNNNGIVNFYFKAFNPHVLKKLMN